VLVTLSHVLAEVPELAELDISLLVVGSDEVRTQTARVRLSALCPSGAAKFAIQPYPQHLIEVLPWCGETLDVRPIRPEDEAQHLDFLRQMSPEDIRMRVFYSRRRIEHTELARLTQIDYAREMAFIATRAHPERGEETLGVVRASIDADNDTAEFGVLIRSDLKGLGLGRLLMQKMLAYLRERGTRQLVATVLRVNQGMRQLAQSLGFQEVDFPPGHQARQETDVCFMVLPLQPATSSGVGPFSPPELHPSYPPSQPPSYPL
jgi:acetyltransferase